MAVRRAAPFPREVPEKNEAQSSHEDGRGRHASTPSEIPARGWKDIIWRVYANIGEDRVFLVGAGVTFYSILALFPAIAALIALYGLVADPGDYSPPGRYAFGLIAGWGA